MSAAYPRPGVPNPPSTHQSANPSGSVPSTAGSRNPAPPGEVISVKTAPVDPMLTTYQAANILRVAPETLKKWRQRHQGPAYVRFDGGVVRYPLSSVLRYIREHAVQP